MVQTSHSLDTFRYHDRHLGARMLWNSVVAGVGGLVVGFDVGATGSITGMPSFRDLFGFDEFTLRINGGSSYDAALWVTLWFTLGGFVGAIPAGSCADFFGRQPTLAASSLMYSVFSVLQISALNIAMLYTGRFLCGMAVGSISTVAPLLLSECAPDHSRGALTSVWQIGITTGIVLAAITHVVLITLGAPHHQPAACNSCHRLNLRHTACCGCSMSMSACRVRHPTLFEFTFLCCRF